MNTNNIAIAKYMGLKPTKVNKTTWVLSQQPWIHVSGPTPEKVWEDISDSLRYDKDWSYLMDVIIKIAKDVEKDMKIRINDEPYDHIQLALLTHDLTATYNAVAEYLEGRVYGDTRLRSG